MRTSPDTRAHLRGLPSGSLSKAEVAVLLDELEDAERMLERCQEANRNLLVRTGLVSLTVADLAKSDGIQVADDSSHNRNEQSGKSDPSQGS